MHSLGQRRDMSCERFTSCLKPFQLFVLLINGLVQFLDQVFLEGNFRFDVYQTFFIIHGMAGLFSLLGWIPNVSTAGWG
jgi:hypothetical protein